ncbi:izumo sperm-egg fusion protein 3 isoform X2 [Perognathus longimembris pacificus]|uniref:izumo sperm-egg fusion protein 3 isoform X2 n=1 Tax=Perognathus longimembris pacificus TaxID=214514 RepID=UPI00201993B0|nr:izumo sperm-egg fusion protein 3 isoform X2 [Perognathus longimembris pacificus]
MGELWLFLFLPLSLVAFHGVKGCLDCDPKFIEDIRITLTKMVPTEVPDRTQLLERQFKEITRLSFKTVHRNKMLRVLAVQTVINLRTWLKNEFYIIGNQTWKGVFIYQGQFLKMRKRLESKLTEKLTTFSEVVVTEGPILDCWTCLRVSSQCFRGEYCGDDDLKKAENREIILFLILFTEAGLLASAVLLFYFCVSHRRKMKTIRRTLKKYLEKKLEELVGMADKEEEKKINDYKI